MHAYLVVEKLPLQNFLLVEFPDLLKLFQLARVLGTQALGGVSGPAHHVLQQRALLSSATVVRVLSLCGSAGYNRFTINYLFARFLKSDPLGICNFLLVSLKLVQETT